MKKFKAPKEVVFGLLVVLTSLIIIFGKFESELDIVVAVNKWRPQNEAINRDYPLAPFCWDLDGHQIVEHPNCKDRFTQESYCGLQNEVNGAWSSSFLKSDPSIAAENVKRLLLKRECDTIIIDFEGLSTTQDTLESWLSIFTKELSGKFRVSYAAYAKNAKVVSNPPANIQNYNFVCKNFHEIWIMTYDYSIPPWTEVGELAPLDWVQDVVEYATKFCRKDQIRVGLAAYGYDWKTGKIIEEKDYNPRTKNPSIELVSKRQKKVEVLRSSGIDKFFVWALGMYDELI